MLMNEKETNTEEVTEGRLFRTRISVDAEKCIVFNRWGEKFTTSFRLVSLRGTAVT